MISKSRMVLKRPWILPKSMVFTGNIIADVSIVKKPLDKGLIASYFYKNTNA
jgi:hypothetical protein